MLVRFLQRWANFRPGVEVELPDGMANALIHRRFAEPVEQPDAHGAPPETAMDSRPRRRAVRRPNRLDAP